MRRLLNSAKLIAVLGLSVLLGMEIRSRSAAVAPGGETAQDGGDAAPIVLAFSGQLSADARSALALSNTASDSLVLVFLSVEDCFTCEDLGRQLRELIAFLPQGYRASVLTRGLESRSTVEEFLRGERIGLPVFALQTGLLTDGRADPATPAAMVVGPTGAVARGVSHVTRQRNVRVVSFAQELGLSPVGLVPLITEMEEGTDEEFSR